MPFEILEMRGSHAMILPHLPTSIPMEGVDKVMHSAKEDSLEKLGLFDSGSPNYYTYYPEVTQADMQPEDGDFIYPVFRLLSKIIIAPKQMAVDFTSKDVLKNSMDLLVGQSIFLDHESITGSVMGVVQSVHWQESYKIGGVTIPAGINGVLKIDAKSNPRVVRAIMMDPPSIHSCSVTINFHWVKSHDLPDNEFYSKLGTFDNSGKRIRKVVDDINLYFELSLVPHGADPFAKKLTGGKIVMAKQASKHYQLSLSANQVNREPYMSVTGTGDLVPYQSATLNFRQINLFDTNSFNINNLNNDEMKFTDLLLSLGLTIEQIPDEEALIAHFQSNASRITDLESEVSTLTSENENLTGEVSTLTNSIEELNTQIATLTDNQATPEVLAMRDAGLAHLMQVRSQALSFYKLLKGDKASEVIVNSINSADLEAALAFAQNFKEEYEAAVPLSCGKCGSTNVSRKTPKVPFNSTEGRKGYLDKASKKETESFLSK
jgi:hypothetical protein